MQFPTKTTSTVTIRTAFPTAARLLQGNPCPGLRAIRRTARDFREVDHTDFVSGEVRTTQAATVTFAGKPRTIVNRAGTADGGWMFEHRPDAIRER